MFQLYRAGGLDGHADDRAMAVAPGDIRLFDMLRALKTRASAFSNIRVIGPRSGFAGLRGDVDALNGVVLAGVDPETGLPADHLEVLVHPLPGLSAAQAETAARSVARAFKAQFGLSPATVRTDSSRHWAAPPASDKDEPRRHRCRRSKPNAPS